MDQLRKVRKSSYSGSNNGNCIAVGERRDGVAVIDTKLDDSPVLRFTPEAWRALVTKVKAS
jgi:hypothetical protein